MAPEPYLSDEHAALYVGGAAEVLGRMPERSVQSVVTSPPYYGLRDYGGHVEQIGQEPTPAAYVESLSEGFGAIERVLRPDGHRLAELGRHVLSSS